MYVLQFNDILWSSVYIYTCTVRVLVIPTVTISLHSPFYRDFTMSYLVQDDYGKEIYLSMLSDWDMDAAIQSASDPCLQLKVDAKPFEEGL